MKVCKFCGSEIDNGVKFCGNCGANEFKYRCDNCGTAFDTGMYCPTCGVKAGRTAKICPTCGAEYYSYACPECGYQPNAAKTVQPRTYAAQQPCVTQQPAPKKRKTWLWVLGWIFIYPVPLTVLLVRSKRMHIALKLAILIAAWLLYIALAFSGSGNA